MRTCSSPQGASGEVGLSGLIAATRAVRRKPIVSRAPGIGLAPPFLVAETIVRLGYRAMANAVVTDGSGAVPA
jgi:hypothetical protein